MTLNTLFGTNVTAPQKIQLRQIKAIYETITVREEVTNYLKTGTRFTSPSQIYDMFSFLMEETKEMFITLHLDGKNRIVCCDLVSLGSLNQSLVHPREIFKTACLSNAAALLCIHNHPTGDPSPSSEDIAITRRLKEAGEIMGIKILDHIIVGEGEYLSFVERGLLWQVRTVVKNEQPWFVAKDLCDVLEIRSAKDAVARLDDDERGLFIVATLGGMQQVSIVNESGMYSLVLSSRKPEARVFKKWITSEVIPSVRKTDLLVQTT